MAIESINIIKKIAKRITASDGSNVVVLFDNVNPILDIPSNTIISVNGFLKNLKGYSKIVSLQEAQLPDIQIEDSEPERRMKALDIEWKSQRKQLDLLVSATGQEWIEVGSISLIRQQGYPYRMYSLLDFFTDGLADEYGNNGKVGCKIVDVGYGLLSGDDIVTVHGSYLQEIVYKIQTQPTNIYLTCNGGNSSNNGDNGDNGNNNGDNEMALTPIGYSDITKQEIMINQGYANRHTINENVNRKYLYIQNKGAYPILVAFSSANIDIELNPLEKFEISKGGFYYIGELNIYTISEYGSGFLCFEA